MPQQDDVIGVTFSPGMRFSSATAAGKAPNAFWWQWPWICASPGIAFSGSTAFSRSRNSLSRKARAASACAGSPGSSARNSSRSVISEEGSMPMTGEATADSASSVRRASARASSTSPAASRVRPSSSGRVPRAGRAMAGS